MVRIIGPKAGRWRAGRHFGAEPVEIPIDDLTEDEKQLLVSDPMLNLSIDCRIYEPPAD